MSKDEIRSELSVSLSSKNVIGSSNRAFISGYSFSIVGFCLQISSLLSNSRVTQRVKWSILSLWAAAAALSASALDSTALALAASASASASATKAVKAVESAWTASAAAAALSKAALALAIATSWASSASAAAFLALSKAVSSLKRLKATEKSGGNLKLSVFLAWFSKNSKILFIAGSLQGSELTKDLIIYRFFAISTIASFILRFIEPDSENPPELSSRASKT